MCDGDTNDLNTDPSYPMWESVKRLPIVAVNFAAKIFNTFVTIGNYTQIHNILCLVIVIYSSHRNSSVPLSRPGHQMERPTYVHTTHTRQLKRSNALNDSLIT